MWNDVTKPNFGRQTGVPPGKNGFSNNYKLSAMMKKRIIAPFVFCTLIILAYWGVLFVYGQSSNSIAKDIEKIGIDKLKPDADTLFGHQSDEIPRNLYPKSISELHPERVDLIHDSTILRIILEDFNGTSETGVYVYKEESTPKRKYEILQIDERVSVYKKID